MSAADFDVPQWLNSLGLGQYEENFRTNEITGASLPALNDEDLKSLGVSALGHRKILLEAIARLTGAKPGVAGVPVVRARVPVATSPGQPRAVKPRVVATAPGLAAQPRAVAAAPRLAAQPRAAAAAPRVAAQPRAAAAPRVAAQPHAVSAAAPAAIPLAVPAAAPSAKRRRTFWATLIGSKFLFISILAHLLFAGAATYLVVQRIQAGRKLTFQGGPPSPNPSKRALEHKVSMAQKRKSGGAPPQARRIVSAGIAKISLPEMPALPSMSNSVTGMMAGMGGAGFGQGMGFGSGMGGGMGGGEGAGGGMTMFGFHDSRAGGLPGEMFDTKQTAGRKPTGMDHAGYGRVVADFIKSGWDESKLRKFYKAKKMLFAGQVFVPDIDAELAPKAFDVEKEIQARMWVALYKGTVTAPESGTFHFVGGGDDILFVRFNGRTVLNGSLKSNGQLGGDDCDRDFHTKTVARYDYHWPPNSQVVSEGEAFSVQEGESYPIEILIGEWPGGRSHFVLFLKKDGDTYAKTPTGAPILPIFRMANVQVLPLQKDQTLPPYRPGGTIWRGQAASGSLLDSLQP